VRLQKTLRREAVLEGPGIHTGVYARLVCRPAVEGTGIRLTRIDLAGEPRWNLTGGQGADAVTQGAGRRTLLAGAGGSVETIEHFMAALWALGIANVRAELTGPELPILDGSALPYIDAFRAAGLEDQSAPIRTVSLSEPVFVCGERSAMLALPHHGLRVTYTLDYPYPGLAGQTVSADLTPETFIASIASARTFCAREEADRLREQGFGKGATTANTLVMTGQGPVDNQLRFSDECARHKILDLIGDLSLLGADVQAQIVAVRSGHALNHQLREALAASAQAAAER
jgi:UDP-3-O-acyl N-acetylglucosamine deacetylase